MDGFKIRKQSRNYSFGRALHRFWMLFKLLAHDKGGICCRTSQVSYTDKKDKKENKIFLIYEENLEWSSCKVIHGEGLPNTDMRKCANISPSMRRPLCIYDFATAPFWIYLYMMKIWFSFLSVNQQWPFLCISPRTFNIIFPLGIYTAFPAVA